MFGLDPFNPSIAISEMLLLLALAAFVGWLLGGLALRGRTRALQTEITAKEAQLADCRQAKGTATPVRSVPADVTAPAYAPPRPEPVPDTPNAYVPTDPMLSAFSPDDAPTPNGTNTPPVSRLTEWTDVSRSDVPVSGNSEAAVLSRIAARSSEVNFDRIGRATAAEADDLKDIVGIGPFLERKLHSLGIYTYRQIANFTKEDGDTINTIVEFFPGRIERDNWIDQASAFHERKYGAGH